MRWKFMILLSIYLNLSCQTPEKNGNSQPSKTDRHPLFTLLSSSETGIEFENLLTLDERFDVFRYRNYYNGGGVAIGDINNDGLPDIYLTANCSTNKLFLNKGNLQFEDITGSAGVGGTKSWSTGVAMADVNGDGYLDIYVCNSGDIEGDDKENELFINNGNLTFSERAAEFGLADQGFSTHAAFFDFDKDGDLDCYLLNNSFRPIATLGYRNVRHIRDDKGGDKLFRNDHGRFSDISEQAGIFGSVIGFGLGVTVGDVDLDGWQDIYISNDFFERDYLYINQRNGTFEEQLTEQMGHTSHFSMGADLADVNNDGFPEIFVTDMLPPDLKRLKQTTQFTSFDEYQTMLRNGFHHQFMRNTLQLNNGDGTFSDISQMTGVHATDWSWGALMADFDNNGFKDIFVCNGIFKDVTDQDFINFLANDENIKAAQMGKKVDFKNFVDRMPSVKLSNFIFSNEGNLRFSNKTEDWGLDKPSHSNGAAYGDLDNDGDLDLIVNNVNDGLMFYRNNASPNADHHFLKFKLHGTKNNPFAVGTKIAVYCSEGTFYFEHMPVRGFQSSMDYTPLIGIGGCTAVDSIILMGPTGEFIRMEGRLPIDTTYMVEFSKGSRAPLDYFVHARKNTAWFGKSTPSLFDENPRHVENEFIDFDRDKLLYHMLSKEGPVVAFADINGDGVEDFYFGGAHRQPGQLFVYDASKKSFKKTQVPDFERDSLFEDVTANWFDADSDGDQDLFVGSGGSEFLFQNDLLIDRLYLNQSSGNKIVFIKAEQSLPKIKRVTSTVVPIDFDKDADLDLFVGTRLAPAGYGIPADAYLLENDGKGLFTDVTASKAPVLRKLGMITAATAGDVDQDGLTDLVIVGDWMPVILLRNQGAQFEEKGLQAIPGTKGMWRSVYLHDLNGDGTMDIFAGNLGLNSRLTGNAENPMRLYIKDFDQNGTIEQIFCTAEKGQFYPIVLKSDLKKVLPSINKKYPTFSGYKDQSITAIFGESLADATICESEFFQTAVFYNRGAEGWETGLLPSEAQYAPVNCAAFHDFNGDGVEDILLAGNFFAAKPEIGTYDASYGTLLLNHGKEHFSFESNRNCGLKIKGQVEGIHLLKLPGNRQVLFIAKNDDQVEILEIQTPVFQ